MRPGRPLDVKLLRLNILRTVAGHTETTVAGHTETAHGVIGPFPAGPIPGVVETLVGGKPSPVGGTLAPVGGCGPGEPVECDAP